MINGFEAEKKVKEYLKENGIITKRTARSGAMFADEDLIANHILIQIKATSKDKYYISQKDMKRLFQNALKYILIPIFIVYKNGDIEIYKVILEDKYKAIRIDIDDLKRMYENNS